MGQHIKLTEEYLLKQGFDYKKEWNRYEKILEGKFIACYPPKPENGGYWICDVWTTYDPVQNNRIVTAEDFDKFMEVTCIDPGKIVKHAVR